MRIFDAANLSTGDFEQILSFLREGDVIGFPTDTAYGLGADPFNESAVRRIFEIKGRPENKPIPVLVDSLDMLKRTATNAGVSDVVHILAKRFWPGPLTLIIPEAMLEGPEGPAGNVSRLVTAGTGTIAVRWPQAPFATRMVHAFGRPITATSANKSGLPSTGHPFEVRTQLGMDLKMLIDGGILSAPQVSTILDVTQTPPAIVREGPVSRAAIAEALNWKLR